MTLALMVNAEALLSQFLRGYADVTALVEDRVYTVTPRNPTEKFPYVRLTRMPGGVTVIDNPLWLDTARIQVDVFGGPKVQTLLIAETIRAAAAQDLRGSHALGVVTDVSLPFNPQYLPDDTFDPPVPRYLFTLDVTTHPTQD